MMVAIAHTLLDAAIGEEEWPRALRRLAASFGGFEANFLVYDRRGSRVEFSAWVDFPHEENPGYARCDALVCSGAGQVILTQKLPERAFLGDEIYNDFLRPLGTRYLMGLKLAHSDSKIAMLRIHRDANRGPYGNAEVRKFGLSLPAFTHAAQIHLQRFHQTRREAVAVAVLDQLQIGVVVIDAELHILHANAFARDLLASGAIAAAPDGVLVLQCPEANRDLRRAHHAASRCSNPSAIAALRFDDIRAGELWLSISPFVNDGSLFLPRDITGAFLVTIKRAEPYAIDNPARLRSAFGLTPAEASIVAEIAHGQSLGQIVSRNAISLNTVKTHLRSIFGKMDVHSQKDLIRAVLSMRR